MIELHPSKLKVAPYGTELTYKFSLVQFLSELGTHILDSYLVVLIALDGII